MVIDKREHLLEPVRNVLATTFSPVIYGVNWPIQEFQILSDQLSRKENLSEQNAHLRVQLSLLQAKLQRYIALEMENKKLWALLQSMPPAVAHIKVARLLAVNLDPTIQQVLIDKGSREGIYIGQAVLDAHGVFGQVISTTPFMSRVLLITDPNAAIPIEDTRSNSRGIVRGDGRNNLVWEYMPITADVKIGDRLVTSGLGGRYPAGYPVGFVSSVSTNAGQPFLNITVTPAAHIDQSELLLLVWNQQNPQIHAQIKAFKNSVTKTMRDNHAH